MLSYPKRKRAAAIIRREVLPISKAGNWSYHVNDTVDHYSGMLELRVYHTLTDLELLQINHIMERMQYIVHGFMSDSCFIHDFAGYH